VGNLCGFCTGWSLWAKYLITNGISSTVPLQPNVHDLWGGGGLISEKAKNVFFNLWQILNDRGFQLLTEHLAVIVQHCCVPSHYKTLCLKAVVLYKCFGALADFSGNQTYVAHFTWVQHCHPKNHYDMHTIVFANMLMGGTFLLPGISQGDPCHSGWIC
jgi:hypothetical protein